MNSTTKTRALQMVEQRNMGRTQDKIQEKIIYKINIIDDGSDEDSI